MGRDVRLWLDGYLVYRNRYPGQLIGPPPGGLSPIGTLRTEASAPPAGGLCGRGPGFYCVSNFQVEPLPAQARRHPRPLQPVQDGAVDPGDAEVHTR